MQEPATALGLSATGVVHCWACQLLRAALFSQSRLVRLNPATSNWQPPSEQILSLPGPQFFSHVKWENTRTKRKIQRKHIEGNNPARHLEPRRCSDPTPLLSPHPPTPHEFTGSAEDDQGEDSRRTDAGSQTPPIRPLASGTGLHCPPSVSGGMGAGTEADECSFKECGKKGTSRRGAGWRERFSWGWGVGEGWGSWQRR